MVTRNWKRLLAGIGTAALLVSNLGSVSTVVFADAPQGETIPASDETEADYNDDSQETTHDEQSLEHDINDLITSYTEGDSTQPVAEGSTSETEADHSDSNHTDSTDETSGDNNSGNNDDSNAGAGTGEQGGSDDSAPDSGNAGENGNTGSGNNDGTGAEDTDAEGNGENVGATDDADVADSENAGDASTLTGSDAAGSGNAGDGTTLTNPDGTGEGTTPENPDALDENEGTENGEDSENKEDDTPALSDSLTIELETSESREHSPAIENGIYLYDLGETAASTLKVSNPEEHKVTEDDGAVVRLYMQFSDAVADETEAIPYKDGETVNEDVKAADVAEIVAEAAVAAIDSSESAGDVATASIEDVSDEDTAEDDGENIAEDNADTSTERAALYNGSYGSTRKQGDYTVTSDADHDYSYTVYELGDGLYCYELTRPVNGETYTLDLTCTYAVDARGGTNEIWAVVLSAEDKAALDTDGIGTADMPEGDALHHTLKWGSTASFVRQETTKTAETDNYTVSVTFGPDSMIPAEAALSVTEYGPDTEVYQKITEQTGETYDWLLDISFLYNEIQLEPQAPVGIKVTAKAIETAKDDEADEAETEATTAEDSVTTITHFADDGTEVIESENVDISENHDGQVETTFELSSLSLVAGTTYKTATVVSSSGYSSGNGYLIYKLYNDEVYFLANLSNTPVTFKVPLADINQNGAVKDSNGKVVTNDIESLGDTLYLNNQITGTVLQNGSSYKTTLTFSNLVWTNTDGYLTNNGRYLKLGYQLSLVSQSSATDVGATINVVRGNDDKYVHITSNYITGYHYEWILFVPYRVDDYTTYQLYFDNYQNEWIKANTASWSDYTIARVGSDYTHKETSHATGGSQDAVYTGKPTDLPLGFYNVKVKKDEATGKSNIEPLPGVTYTIYDETGNTVGAIVSTDDMRVSLELLGLGRGKYTMRMTGVPEGYVCDNDTWAFEIKDDTKILSLTNKNGEGDLEGIIVVNPIGNIEMGKTASAYDYGNRVYQVDLTAHSGIQQAQIDSLHINFVVDQSNSMLFPSGLKDTGKTITLRGYRNSDDDAWLRWQFLSDGFMGTNGLSKDQVYYIVVQQLTSSTVMAIWYKEDANVWCYQDASYYAKAFWKGNLEKVNTEDDVAYPDGDYKGDTDDYHVAGGYIIDDSYQKWNIKGSIQSDAQDTAEHTYTWSEDSSGKKCTDIKYTVYTATNEFNRLHYLEQSLTQMLEMLGTMCPDATVTLDTFYWEPKECSKTKNNGEDYVLGKDYSGKTGLDRLLDMVGNITTGGGTRQDKALKHVYENHISGDTCKNKYVVLITDGAPAGSGTIVGATASVGDGNVDSTSKTNDVYMQVNYWAQQVKNSATLATVGLSMKDVKSGSIAMRYISSDYDQFNSTQFGYASNRLDKSGQRYANGYVNGAYSPTHGNWWYQPDDSSELTKILCEDIMEQIVATSTVNDDPGQVTDYISDSFYPVDKEVPYKALESGTRIELDGTACKDNNGNYIKNDSSYGKGIVLQDGETKSWYVKWDEMSLSGTTKGEKKETNTYTGWLKGDTSRRYSSSWPYNALNSYTEDGKTYTWQWHDDVRAYWYYGEITEETITPTEIENKFEGRIYIKAKEDYIGGNGIETNGNLMSKDKDTGEYTSATLEMKYGGTMEYDMPSVNVRLLEMNQKTSKVTVLKGDNINSDTAGPESSVKIFFDDVSFGKLVSGKDDVTNKVGAKELGVGEDAFSLGYAGVTLTADQWTALKNGESIQIPYSYRDKDGNSRDGAVGYFTIELAETAVNDQTPDWGVHPATVANGDANGDQVDGPYGSNWIEKYTLNVTYTAYKLGEEGRPATTRYNGQLGAGTEVRPDNTSGVTSGQGIVKSTNIHYVYALETYELPNTGGMGTLPLELGGFAAMLGSMFVGYSRRRRHRKEGEM